MAGGPYDSSLTRVQPTFIQLAQGQPTGVPWLGQLLRLGSRSPVLALPRDDEWTGLLTHPVRQSFEYPCAPPKAYLERVVCEAPSRMPEGVQLQKLEQRVSKEAARKRKQLRERDPAVVKEALTRLANGRTAPAWWVLEGTTMVDCALFAEHVTVFVEGKRTEPHLTTGVSWDTRRHQVFRSLDVLEALPGRQNQYLTLLVVDDENDQVLKEANELDRQPNVAFASWPHRKPDEAEALWSHYCGFTTWQKVASAFRLHLPQTRDDAMARGLTIGPPDTPGGTNERR